MSRRTLLLILAILAALAVSSLRLTIERRDSSPWVGDFPSARRSSRGPVPVSLPFVVGLVVPSVQARRRAMQAKHRERPRALRPWQCWAYWSLSLCCGRRYRSAQRPERVRAWSVRERCESPEVARPHLRSASPRWAGWLPLRCRMPRMPVIDQAHRRPARRYQGAGCAPLAPNWLQVRGLLRLPSWSRQTESAPLLCEHGADERQNPNSADSFGHEPWVSLA